MRRIMLVVLAAALVLAVSPGVAAAQDIPPCIVEVDLRYDPGTAAFTTLTMWWFIDDVAARPGIYFWNHIRNDRTTTAVNVVDKDDNLHTALPMTDDLGRQQWDYGDVYTFQAVHYSPATNTSYVAAYNRCVITLRTA